MQPNDSQAQPYPTSGPMAHGDQPAYGQAWPPQGVAQPGPYGHQQPPPYAQQPPPYLQAPPPYLQQTDAARVVKLQKGRRDIAFGVVWLVAGLLITGITMGSSSPVYIVAWGPMLYGLYKIIKGTVAISANKE